MYNDDIGIIGCRMSRATYQQFFLEISNYMKNGQVDFFFKI